MIKEKWVKGEYNEVLKRKGYYISYNSNRNKQTLSKLLGIMASLMEIGDKKFLEDNEETAICMKGSYAILNGDFRKDYEKCKTLKECLAFYRKNIKYKSVWSTYK